MILTGISTPTLYRMPLVMPIYQVLVDHNSLNLLFWNNLLVLIEFYSLKESVDNVIAAHHSWLVQTAAIDKRSTNRNIKRLSSTWLEVNCKALNQVYVCFPSHLRSGFRKQMLGNFLQHIFNIELIYSVHSLFENKHAIWIYLIVPTERFHLNAYLPCVGRAL